MRFCWKVIAAAAVLSMPVAGLAATCTMQAELSPQDREVLAVAAGRLAQAVAEQDLTGLKAALLPSEASAWDGISGAVQQAQALMQGGQIHLKESNTRVDTLRETYGADFGGSIRGDAHLGTLLERTGHDSLTDYLKTQKA